MGNDDHMTREHGGEAVVSEGQQEQPFVPEEPLLVLEDENLRYYAAFVEGKRTSLPVDDAKTAKFLQGIVARRGYSFATLFAGPAYLAYRKCYLGAVLLIGACISVFFLGAAADTRLFRTLPLIIAGGAFYPLYRYQAQRALQQAQTRGLSDPEAIEEFMRRKGGTSALAASVAVVAYALIVTFAVATVLGYRLDIMNAVF